MIFEIDQSGRIEETNRDTVLAIASHDKSFTVRIQARVKRRILSIYKSQGKPKLFAILTFAKAVVLILKKSRFSPKIILVDIEYPGHGKVIKTIIEKEIPYEIEVRFKSIGKGSPAHVAAYFTFKKRLKENCTCKNIEELLHQE